MRLGTSIGIAVRQEHLEIVCVRARWGKLSVSGFLRIENFLTQPAPEIARSYERFRKDNHATAVSAIVALPRGAGLIRTLELPAEVAPNLAQTITYQVDSLHPFGDGGVYYDHSLLPSPPGGEEGAPASRIRVAVALVEKSTADSLYDFFAGVGIDVAAFTLSTAGLYQALTEGHTSVAPVLVIDRAGGSIELLGLAPDGGFCSKQVDAGAPLARELQFCAAEMRLAPEQKPRLLPLAGAHAVEGWDSTRLEQGTLANLPHSSAAGFDLRDHFTAYAAALAGLDRRWLSWRPQPGLRWNLLPREKRVYRSHWGHLAAYGLTAAVVLLAIAWILTGVIQDRLYASWLDARISELKPRVEYVEKLGAREKELLDRLELLDRQQQDVARKLEAMQELTRLLPNGAWLQGLIINDAQVSASGQADSTSGLLQSFNNSPYFEQAEYSGAISKSNEGKEVFQVRMRLRPVVLSAAQVPPTAAPNAAAPAGAPGQQTGAPGQQTGAPATPASPAASSPAQAGAR